MTYFIEFTTVRHCDVVIELVCHLVTLSNKGAALLKTISNMLIIRNNSLAVERSPVRR